MSITFSGSELLNIAIGIEERGVAFYEAMAEQAKSASAREVFRYLADMEKAHRQTFQGMFAEADKYEFAKTGGEYAVYLQALVDSAVFSEELILSQIANAAQSEASALDLAIGAEKDSILFYYEMKEIMPQKAQPTVNKIIAEEKAHLRQLTQLKKKLTEL